MRSAAASAWPSDLPAPNTREFWDPEVFLPHTKIRTKSRGLQPFQLWEHQRILADATRSCYATGRWLAHVKPRQEGSSTYFSAVATQHACFRPGCRVGILAHKRKTAKSLAAIVNRTYLSLPVGCRPKRQLNLRHGLELPGMDSGVDIASVQDDEPLRGETVQVLVATEISSWSLTAGPDAWTSALNAVPDEGGFVIAESTPKYYGDELHQLTMDILKGDPKWSLVFIPWTRVEQYAKEPPPGWRPNSLVQEYLDAHPEVTAAQAFWLETVGLPKCRNDLEKFLKEYPISIEEAWLPSSDAVFDKDQLLRWLEQLDPDWNTGTWSTPVTEAIEFKPPEAGRRYVIAVDPAGGWSKRDLWGVVVLDLWSCEVVAEFTGHRQPFPMAQLLKALGERYNRATVYIEANGVGEAVIAALLHLDYPNVYHRDTEGGQGEPKPGWWSSVKTKAQAIGYAQEMVRDGSVGIKSVRLLRQLLNYRGQWDKVDKSQRDQAGGHFDLVAAFCVACWAWHAEGGGQPGAIGERDRAEANWQRTMAWLDRLRMAGSGDPSQQTPWGAHR